MAGNIISKAAFAPPIPTYDSDLSGLTFIDGFACLIYPRDLPYDKTLLYCHGNAEDVGLGRDYMKFLSEQLQVNTVSFDYEGYGLSLGEPSELAVYTTTQWIYLYVKNTLHIKPSTIFVMGRSLGSAAAIDLVTAFEPPAGLILVSPLTSAVRVVLPETVAMLLAHADIFVNITKIERVECDVLIIHGDSDEVIPWSHGSQLAKKCSRLWKFITVRDGTHNNSKTTSSPAVIEQIKDFIEHCS